LPTIPNLIHPIPVTIELLVHDQSVFNDKFREPVGGGARPQRHVILGQVFDQDTINNAIPTGLIRIVEGYVTFRVVDILRILPRRLQRNDRIVQFGTGANVEPVNFYLYRLRRRGHYSKGATLNMWWYTAMEPTRTDGQHQKDFTPVG
jgi:hypothetical protein